MRRSRIADTLRAAAGLVRQGWTQWAAARNAKGWAVHSNSQHAICWCALGAIGRAAGEGRSARRAERCAVLWASRRLGGSVLAFVAYNDAPRQTAEEVACALEAAAEEREGRGR